MSSEQTGDNYYLILGVVSTATPDDITAAYHDLARKYHPDTGASDSAALSKFKQVNEAYEVLSDEQKRRDYDRRRSAQSRRPTRAASAASFGFGPAAKQKSSSQRSNKPAFTTSPGPLDIEVELPITPEEARCGGPCVVTVTTPRDCEQCGGRGRIDSSWCDMCEGKGQLRGQRRLQFELPRGLRTGSVLRIARPVHHGTATTGELLLRIKILPYW